MAKMTASDMLTKTAILGVHHVLEKPFKQK